MCRTNEHVAFGAPADVLLRQDQHQRSGLHRRGGPFRKMTAYSKSQELKGDVEKATLSGSLRGGLSRETPASSQAANRILNRQRASAYLSQLSPHCFSLSMASRPRGQAG